jgi:hypothetical protein
MSYIKAGSLTMRLTVNTSFILTCFSGLVPGYATRIKKAAKLGRTSFDAKASIGGFSRK